MLQPFMHVLNAQKVILASGSPRRKQILHNIGLKFEIKPSTFEENLDKTLFPGPGEYVGETARLKTLSVLESLVQDNVTPDLVIGADSVIAIGNKIYEKPKDRQNAFEMLSRFSGGYHKVYTGVALITPVPTSGKISGTVTDDGRFQVTQFCESTEVKMADLTEEIINSYLDTGEGMDKAGSYGIQAIGGTLVEGIKGDYFNVMGFPLHRFAKELSALYMNSKK